MKPAGARSTGNTIETVAADATKARALKIGRGQATARKAGGEIPVREPRAGNLGRPKAIVRRAARVTDLGDKRKPSLGRTRAKEPGYVKRSFHSSGSRAGRSYKLSRP